MTLKKQRTPIRVKGHVKAVVKGLPVRIPVDVSMTIAEMMADDPEAFICDID